MASVQQLLFSKDGQRLAALSNGGSAMDRRVMVWDVPSWQLVSEMQLPDVGWQIAFSPDGRWLAAGVGQGIEQPPVNAAILWDVASGNALGLMPHAQQVLAVSFSHHNQWLATGSSDGTVTIWQLPQQ